MKLINYITNLTRKSKAPVNIEKKSFIFGGNSFLEYLSWGGWENLSFYQAIKYYQQCAPLNSAINLISDNFSTIFPYIFDHNKEEYIKQHPLLDLLYYPNADSIGEEFFKQIIAYYLITGNVYIVAIGNVLKPPKELYVISPAFVSLNPGKDGYTETITVNANTPYSETFTRQSIKGRFRYYSQYDDKEIWHIKTFNPLQSANNLYGMSPLMPIWYEIEQYINASIHNLSLLNRGARPSGALSSENILTEDQFARLQEQIDRFYSGAHNAGRPMLFEGGVTFQEMSMSNKDMDFLELKKNVINSIYSALKIPLPIISPDHTTMNNMEISKLDLYDNAVLPLTNRIYKELSNFLIHRYPDLKKASIDYSEDEIPALEPRRNEELNKLKMLDVLTINELRARIGYEAITGGDDIYQPASILPIGTDVYTENNLRKPYPQNTPADESDVERSSYYIEVLSKQLNPDGTPKYTMDEILKYANKYGL